MEVTFTETSKDMSLGSRTKIKKETVQNLQDFYQIRHLCLGFMKEPIGHLNTRAKS